MDPILAKLWEVSPLVAVLGLALLYFYKRDMRNDAKADARHSECEIRNTKLDERIQALEARQFDLLHDLTERGVAGLADSTSAIKRMLGDPLTPRDSFPARRNQP